jgi:hypothetical protein
MLLPPPTSGRRLPPDPETPQAGHVPRIALPRQSPGAAERAPPRRRQPAAGSWDVIAGPWRGACHGRSAPNARLRCRVRDVFYAVFAVSLAFPRRTGAALRTIAFGAFALLPSQLPHRVSSSPILTSSTQKIVSMTFLGALLGESYGRTGGLAHPSRPFTAVVACLVLVVAGQAFLVETRALDRELLAMIGAGIIVAVALLFTGPRRPSDRVSQTTSLSGDASSASIWSTRSS